jgi:hypothetical protein
MIGYVHLQCSLRLLLHMLLTKIRFSTHTYFAVCVGVTSGDCRWVRICHSDCCQAEGIEEGHAYVAVDYYSVHCHVAAVPDLPDVHHTRFDGS